MTNNVILLADGFEEIEAVAPLDLLRRAGIDVATVSVEQTQSVRGSNGIVIEADKMIGEYDGVAQLIILPGGPGHTRLDACERVHTMLADCYKSGGILAAICAAPSILGRHGYLGGKSATCYRGYERQLLGANVLRGGRRNVITDGRIITAAAAGNAVEFGLEIIAVIKGGQEANRIASDIGVVL